MHLIVVKVGKMQLNIMFKIKAYVLKQNWIKTVKITTFWFLCKR